MVWCSREPSSQHLTFDHIHRPVHQGNLSTRHEINDKTFSTYTNLRQNRRGFQNIKWTGRQGAFSLCTGTFNKCSLESSTSHSRNGISWHCSDFWQWTNDHWKYTAGQAKKQITSCTWNIRNSKKCIISDPGHQVLKKACHILQECFDSSWSKPAQKRYSRKMNCSPYLKQKDRQSAINNQRIQGLKLRDLNKWTRKMKLEKWMIGEKKQRSKISSTISQQTSENDGRIRNSLERSLETS